MSETELQVLPSLPEGFLECGSRDLYKVLGGPTLIHLPGNQPDLALNAGLFSSGLFAVMIGTT